MPYKESASVSFTNNYSKPVDISLETYVDDFDWDSNTLYFHSTYHFEKAIPLNNEPDSNDNLDWNFATINGRGVYCGDLLSLYNHAVDWYGEGDEKIWIDNDTFPSHFGTGTEDYFNCSWAPVVPFLTPYGVHHVPMMYRLMVIMHLCVHVTWTLFHSIQSLNST